MCKATESKMLKCWRSFNVYCNDEGKKFDNSILLQKESEIKMLKISFVSKLKW